MSDDTKREIALSSLVAAWRRVLAHDDVPQIYLANKIVPVRIASSPFGLLPAWLAEVDRIWKDMCGQPIAISLIEQPAAPLGAVVTGPPALPASAVLACMTWTALNQLKTHRGVEVDSMVARFYDVRDGYLAPPALEAAPGGMRMRP